MCNTLSVKFFYPLVVVGLVAVVVVHGHVLEAPDNLETYLNEFLVKKHPLNMCHMLKLKI